MRPDGQGFAHRTTKKIVGFIIAALIFVPLFIFIFTEIVLHLWNWLMPALFHLATITFWQAIGLMILCWILFGGLRGLRAGGMRYHGRRRDRWERACWEGDRARDSWESMSQEERDKFREWLRSRGAASGPTPYAGT